METPRKGRSEEGRSQKETLLINLINFNHNAIDSIESHITNIPYLNFFFIIVIDELQQLHLLKQLKELLK